MNVAELAAPGSGRAAGAAGAAPAGRALAAHPLAAHSPLTRSPLTHSLAHVAHRSPARGRAGPSPHSDIFLI